VYVHVVFVHSRVCTVFLNFIVGTVIYVNTIKLIGIVTFI